MFSTQSTAEHDQVLGSGREAGQRAFRDRAAKPRGVGDPHPEAQTLQSDEICWRTSNSIHARAPATERSCATNRAAETVMGSAEPRSGSGSRPRVAGWPEGRPEPGDWRLDKSG